MEPIDMDKAMQIDADEECPPNLLCLKEKAKGS